VRDRSTDGSSRRRRGRGASATRVGAESVGLTALRQPRAPETSLVVCRVHRRGGITSEMGAGSALASTAPRHSPTRPAARAGLTSHGLRPSVVDAGDRRALTAKRGERRRQSPARSGRVLASDWVSVVAILGLLFISWRRATSLHGSCERRTGKLGRTAARLKELR